LCGKYIQLFGPTRVLAMKAAPKQLNNQLDIWVRSLGKRAIKKADYLAAMKEWHKTAKAKYKNRKIRCSGMLVANNGLGQIITNQSGHYAPNTKSIYYFVSWLRQRNCLHANARVEMEHDHEIADGTYKAADFLNWARPKYPAPAGLQYWV
jgi:hypothetical protein